MLARVPWTPPVKAKPKPRRMNADRRRGIVERTVRILKEGDPTRFAFEAVCRHAIRSKLCLEGWKWQEADAVAVEIVATALRQIGARRPSWAEGQPEFLQLGAGAQIERTRCVRCRKPLPEDHRKFCSTLCANAHHMHLAAVREAEEADAYDRVAGYRSRAA